MINHWEALDLEIIDFEYQYDPTLSREIIPSQTSRYFYMWILFFMRDGVEHPASEASR